jgi:hypothetical protein
VTDRPGIERPWAPAFNWELVMTDEGDWAAVIDQLPVPTLEERLAAVQRYLQACYAYQVSGG